MYREKLYVLRLWRGSDRPESWRASLEDVRSREKVSFERLADLCSFLAEQDVPPAGSEE